MAVANEVVLKPAVKAVPSVDATVANDPNRGAGEREQLRMMMLIRRFEDRTYTTFTQGGKIGGFCHLYSGQEAVAVGIAPIFQKGKDYLVNGDRCHGHSLALGMEPRKAMAELF